MPTRNLTDAGSGGGIPLVTAGQGGTNDIGAGTQPLTGFARRYDPAMLNSIIWDSPWAVLPDVFKGINTAGPGYAAMRDLGADPLTLYNLMAGASSDLTSAGAGGYANWLNSLYGSMGKVGGRQISAAELLGNIFNQGGANSNTALARILASGDAGTQVRTLFNLVRDATNAGMNPMAARGYQTEVVRRGDEYLNQALRSAPNEGVNNQLMYEWLRQKHPGLVPR